MVTYEILWDKMDRRKWQRKNPLGKMCNGVFPAGRQFFFFFFLEEEEENPMVKDVIHERISFSGRVRVENEK